MIAEFLLIFKKFNKIINQNSDISNTYFPLLKSVVLKNVVFFSSSTELHISEKKSVTALTHLKPGGQYMYPQV